MASDSSGVVVADWCCDCWRVVELGWLAVGGALLVAWFGRIRMVSGDSG